MAHIRLEHITRVYGRPGQEWGAGPSRARVGFFAVLLGRRGEPRSLVEEESARAELGLAGPVRALGDVSLDIADGETLSLIGPSGCGKSTLLRVVAGLEPPDAGRVFYDGEDMAGVAPGARGIGMVFQNYALYPHMTSRGNLAFFFRVHHREEEVDERVRFTASVLGVGFAELLNRKPGKLSGGQQQRVAIGRCITRDPRLFLLDEPLANLDAKLRSQTRVEIKRLLQHFHTTSIYVTHDQTEAIALGDRLAVMHEGRIQQVGPYWHLYRRPVNRFVAGFISPLTGFLPAVVTERGLLLAGQEVSLESGRPVALQRGQDIVVGVRPEGFRVTSEGPDALRVQVEVVQHHPSERSQLVYLNLAGQPLHARLAEDLPLAPGQWLDVALEAESVLFFDPRTGEAVR